MDVIFETSRGKSFVQEIGFFDTVREMKEKIHKYHGIPASRQTLSFNGLPMSDDRDTEFYGVLEGSRLHLAIAPDLDNPSKHQIFINIASSKRKTLVELDAVTDTVAKMKERVQEMEGIPASRFGLFVGGTEMQDMQKTVADYGISDGSELNMVIKPSGAATVATTAGKKVKVVVVSKCGTRRIPVEVNQADNVSELRKVLQRMQGELQLPVEGFFFIYRQNVMDEDRTFRWHDVRANDVIEIFNGNVTDGS